MLDRVRSLGVVALLACVAAGCTDWQRRTQLERVAKDWCETIRASQVIPVYPLTEDLRPGDVFLVRYPIASQQDEWKHRGYLALDDHRVRLGAGGEKNKVPEFYTKMYFDGYWKDEFGGSSHPRPVIAIAKEPLPPVATETPKKDAPKADESKKTAATTTTPDNATVLRPATDTSDTPAPADAPAPKARDFPLSTAEAPRAAFPSYSFQVRNGAGASLAIPIKGVPVGLSFMRTGNADGMVTIGDAYTYGADPGTMYGLVMRWAGDNREMLDDAARQAAENRVFLRVVTRVYLTGGMSVSLTNAESGAAAAKAGADVDVKLFNEDGTFNKRYKDLLSALDEQANKPLPHSDVLKKFLPGGAVKFAWASSRAVAMDETFDTPLVVGYLGFDVPVYAGATPGEPEFGFPVPTWSVLEKKTGAFAGMRSMEGRLLQQQYLLRGLTGGATQPDDVKRAGIVMSGVITDLQAEHPAFAPLAPRVEAVIAMPPSADRDAKLRELVTQFNAEATDYITTEPRKEHLRRYCDAFDRGFEQSRAPAAPAAAAKPKAKGG